MDRGRLRPAAWKTQHGLERDFHELYCSSDFGGRFAYEMNFDTVRRGASKEANRVGIHNDRLVPLVGQLHKFYIILLSHTYSAFPASVVSSLIVISHTTAITLTSIVLRKTVHVS
jgi:hypothetical protein